MFFVQFQVHEKTHTGETLYQCQTCPKQFDVKSKWRDHMRNHCPNRKSKAEEAREFYASFT